MAFIDVLRDPGKRIDYVLAMTGSPKSGGADETHYFSMAGRRDSAAHANPGGVDMNRLLIDPGGHIRGLSADRNFGGLAEVSIDVFSLLNRAQHPEHLYWMTEYSWHKKPLVLYGGERGAAWSTFEAIHTTVTDGEPTIEPTRVRVRPASPLREIQVPFPASVFVGQETALDVLALSGDPETEVPFTTASGLGDYNLTSFTATVRVRLDAPDQFHHAYFVSILDDDKAGINDFFSMGLISLSPLSYELGIRLNQQDLWTVFDHPEDGIWKTWIFSVRKNGFWYWAIDDEEVVAGQNPRSPVPPSAATVKVAQVLGFGSFDPNAFDLMDVRIYSGFRSHDEALALLAGKSSQTDPLVSSWRLDDSIGKVATDYGNAGNDATSSTAESPSAFWIASGEGNEDFTAKVKPEAVGEPRQTPADLISSNWKQYALGSHNDGQFNGVSFRSKGVESLTEADPEVDLLRGLVTVGTLEDDPTTAELELASLPTKSGKSTEEMVGSILSRAGITSFGFADIDSIIGRMTAGAWIEGGEVGRIVSDLLSGTGGFLTREKNGDWRLSFLREPVSPTPLSAPCIDTRGIGQVTYASASIDFSTDKTLMFWLNSQNFFSFVDEGLQGYASAPTALRVFNPSSDLCQFGVLFGKKLFFESFDQGSFNLHRWQATIPDLQEDEWIFVAATWDASGAVDGVRLYAGKSTTDFDELDTANPASIGTLGKPAGDPLIGVQWPGGVGRALVRDEIMTKDEIQSYMFRDPSLIDPSTDTSIEFWAEHNEGEGSPVDQVSDTTGSLNSGAIWSPQLKLHLKKTRSSIPEEQMLTPSKRTVVYFDRNHAPMSAAEVDTITLTKQQQIDARRKVQEITLRSRRGDKLREYESAILVGEREGVVRLARLLHERFRDKVVSRLKTPYRPALVQEEGYDVWVQGPVPGYNAIRPFKVAMARPRYGRGETELTLWGKRRSVSEDEEAAEGSGGLLTDGEGNYLADSAGNHLSGGELPEIEL